MKGIVFTEFLDMVEEKFSPEMVDQLIESSDLSTDGAYTSVGTYHHGELIQMVVKLSEVTDIDISALVKAFGSYLFNTFTVEYPAFFEAETSTFGFLSTLENHIHVEVKKLYPDAELPTFNIKQEGDNLLSMEYNSSRPFAPLAEGLMESCAEFYKENITIDVEDKSDGKNNHAVFKLTHHPD